MIKCKGKFIRNCFHLDQIYNQHSSVLFSLIFFTGIIFYVSFYNNIITLRNMWFQFRHKTCFVFIIQPLRILLNIFMARQLSKKQNEKRYEKQEEFYDSYRQQMNFVAAVTYF